MKHLVVRLVRGLMPEKISVSSGVEELLVALLLKLAHGQSDRAVRVFLLYIAYDRDYQFIRIERILAALHHKGSETKLIADVAAGQDLLFAEAVTLAVCVAAAYAAVIAVVPADVGDLDEASKINILAVIRFTYLAGLFGDILVKTGSVTKQDSLHFFVCQVMLSRKSVCQVFPI